MAQGDFIYLIASDDAMKSSALRILCDFLTEHPDYVLAVGDNEVIDSESWHAFWDKDRNFVYEELDVVFRTVAEYLQKSTGISFSSEKFGS